MRYVQSFTRELLSPNEYRPHEVAYYRLPAIVFVIDVVLSLVLAGILTATDSLEEVEALGIPIISFWFVPFLLLVSTIEELIFRIVPLTIAMSVSERRLVHMLTAAIGAGIFGYLHGGLANIPLQGIGGFLYGLLFIRYAYRGERFLEASIVIILMHTAFNGMLGLLLLLGGETMF